MLWNWDLLIRFIKANREDVQTLNQREVVMKTRLLLTLFSVIFLLGTVGTFGYAQELDELENERMCPDKDIVLRAPFGFVIIPKGLLNKNPDGTDALPDAPCPSDDGTLRTPRGPINLNKGQLDDTSELMTPEEFKAEMERRMKEREKALERQGEDENGNSKV